MDFWVPGKDAPGVDRDFEDEGIYIVNSAKNQFNIDQQRKSLPIYRYRRQILYAVEYNHVVVIQGETGCGKSTQIPQYLYEAGWAEGGRCIACTQPRRIAATAIAKRVAEEKKSVLGEEVGYCVRFDYKFNKNNKMTGIKYLTDKELLREMTKNPLLNQYSVIMVDEVHERSIENDILLGVLKRILPKRPDLRVIISSASMKVELFEKYFGRMEYGDDEDGIKPCCVMSVQGRQYPVEICYAEQPVANYIEGCAKAVLSIHNSSIRGDILVFLPSEDEIELCKESLIERSNNQHMRNGQIWVVLLHSNLPYSEQKKVFQPTPRGFRKVILSTGMGETSISIDNVTCVVDSGFEMVTVYNKETSINAQIIQPISKSSAEQRAGRAGRFAEGHCYRLYTEEDYTKLEKRSKPEIKRLLMCDAVLLTRQLGIKNLDTFDLISENSSSRYYMSCQLLGVLGALEQPDFTITPRGHLIYQIPVDTQLASFLLFSKELDCVEEALTIAAFSSVSHLYKDQPKDTERRNEYEKSMGEIVDERGDQYTYLKIYEALTNPPVDEEADNTIRRDKHAPTAEELSLFCSQFYLNVYAMKKALELRVQYKYFMDRLNEDEVHSLQLNKVEEGTVDPITECLIRAYFKNICRLSSNGSYVPYNLLNESGMNNGNIDVYLHEDSILNMANKVHPWVLFKDIQLTDAIYIRDVIQINPIIVMKLLPQFYKSLSSENATEATPTPAPMMKRSYGPEKPSSSNQKSSGIRFSADLLGKDDKLRDLFRF